MEGTGKRDKGPPAPWAVGSHCREGPGQRVWRYLHGVVGGQRPRPLHHGGRGAVQQLQRVLHCGKGGKGQSLG